MLASYSVPEIIIADGFLFSKAFYLDFLKYENQTSEVKKNIKKTE